MPVRKSTFAGLLAMAAAAPLLAATPAEQVRSRIASYRELGAAFKNVNDALRTPQPSLMILQISTRQIAATGRDQYHWFPVGTGPEAGVRTKAKREIWSDGARFKAAQDAFAAQSAALDRAARGGNLTAIRLEARKLGGTCKACHDKYRLPDE
jgi:cytochrome c556